MAWRRGQGGGGAACSWRIRAAAAVRARETTGGRAGLARLGLGPVGRGFFLKSAESKKNHRKINKNPKMLKQTFPV